MPPKKGSPSIKKVSSPKISKTSSKKTSSKKTSSKKTSSKNTKDIEEICNLDPRVYPTLINVNEYERGYLIEVSLSMKNTDQSSSMRMVFDQKIGLKLQ